MRLAEMKVQAVNTLFDFNQSFSEECVNVLFHCSTLSDEMCLNSIEVFSRNSKRHDVAEFCRRILAFCERGGKLSELRKKYKDACIRLNADEMAQCGLTSVPTHREIRVYTVVTFAHEKGVSRSTAYRKLSKLAQHGFCERVANRAKSGKNAQCLYEVNFELAFICNAYIKSIQIGYTNDIPF